jgi:hypothetical protein
MGEPRRNGVCSHCGNCHRGVRPCCCFYNAGSTYWRERKLRELGFGFEAFLAQRKSELSREEAAARARTEYEYNARLSLYQRFEPLLFQLLDLGDYALDRIKNLAEPSVWTKFVVAEVSPPRMRRAPVAKPDYEDDWMKFLRLEDPDDYRWKAGDHSPSLEDTLMAADGHLRRYVAAPRISSAQ